MLPEEIALIADIHADPKNDAPRLAYAAWLARNSIPDIAEFIRVQCQPPYIRLDTYDGVRRSFDDSDMEGSEVADRAIALLDRIPAGLRYPKAGESYSRGLPVYEEEVDDDHLALPWEKILRGGNPLARFSIRVRTANLALWLQHPCMARVDVLHILPDFPPEDEPDEDSTMNSHRDAFWEENILILAASPLIDRLEELHPHGCQSVLHLTERSRHNMALCKRLLEPRVHVEYSY